MSKTQIKRADESGASMDAALAVGKLDAKRKKEIIDQAREYMVSGMTMKAARYFLMAKQPGPAAQAYLIGGWNGSAADLWLELAEKKRATGDTRKADEYVKRAARSLTESNPVKAAKLFRQIGMISKAEKLERIVSILRYAGPSI